VEVTSHSAQPHKVSQPKAPVKERGLGAAPTLGELRPEEQFLWMEILGWV